MIQRILIIDDSEEMESVIHMCVEKHWPDAEIEMYDPLCGIPERFFNWSRYDLLLLDFDLGIEGENGLDWYTRLESDPHLPPTIIMSDYVTRKLVDKAKSIGVDGLINKGKISPDIFLKKLELAIKIAKQKKIKLAQRSSNDNTQLLSAAEKKRVLDSILERSDDTLAGEQEKTEDLGTDVTTNSSATGSAGSSQKSTMSKPVTMGQSRTQRTPSRPTTNPRLNITNQPKDIPVFVPGYTISKKIGEGGMAAIYLAERDEDQLKVVLKVLSLKQKDDTNLLRRFMREYKLIAQINHPNIVEIYERAFASDFAYIAMEYFPCGDLARRLKAGLDSKTAISFLHQIAEGLGAAHEKGIVHRDMKPANILFRTPDNLAITDFGIAKAVESDNLQKHLTMDGELMGTLYYISPEQILGKEADNRSDIYSLGVIMYKMLTGQHPFIGETPADVFEGHLNAPVPLLPEPFTTLQPLLDGLLSKDPDERFQSTEDLLMGLNWQEWT